MEKDEPIVLGNPNPIEAIPLAVNTLWFFFDLKVWPETVKHEPDEPNGTISFSLNLSDSFSTKKYGSTNLSFFIESKSGATG